MPTLRPPDLELLRGTLDLLILKTLSWEPMHGLGVLRWIEQVTEQRLQIEEGALYPALHRLEQRGWLEAEWRYTERNRKAKYYRLTPVGRQQLAAELSKWSRYTEAGGLILAAQGAREASMALDRRGWPGLSQVFRLPASRRRLRQEIDDELRFHFEDRVEELMAGGLTRAAAEVETRRRFGDYERYRSESVTIDEQTIRERVRMDTLGALRRESRQALRTLGRSQAFSTIAIATLASGIGATTAIFTILDAVVLRPLPYAAADRLVYLQSGVPGVGRDTKWGLSVAGYFHFRDNASALEALGAYTTSQANFGASDGAERVPVALVSGSIFEVLGVRTIAGRTLRNEDNLRGAPSVVVLGHDFWERHFASDPAVIGRTIQLHSSPFEVVGVLEPGVHLPQDRVDAWMPATLDPGSPPVNSHYLNVIGRLRDGVGLEAARSELSRLTRRFPEVFPSAYSADFIESSGFVTEVLPLHQRVVGNYDRILWILLGAVSLVLLIACANVANLFLVRTEGRRRELAIRTALGGDRRHLAWHYLTESVLLAVMAGA